MKKLFFFSTFFFQTSLSMAAWDYTGMACGNGRSMINSTFNTSTYDKLHLQRQHTP